MAIKNWLSKIHAVSSFCRSNLISSFHLCLSLQVASFPQVFPPKSTHLSAPAYVPRALPVSFFLFSSLENFWQRCKTWRLSLRYFLQFPITSSLFRPDVFFSALFSSTSTYVWAMPNPEQLLLATYNACRTVDLFVTERERERYVCERTWFDTHTHTEKKIREVFRRLITYLWFRKQTGRQKIIGLTFLMVCYINVTNTYKSQSLVVRINSTRWALYGQLAFSIWPMNFPDFIDAALTRPTRGSAELIHTHTHTHVCFKGSIVLTSTFRSTHRHVRQRLRMSEATGCL